MIDVQQPQNKQDFILALKDGRDLWCIDEPYQCRLFIKQQGAGNGKTYGIIQMLEHEDFEKNRESYKLELEELSEKIIHKMGGTCASQPYVVSESSLP